VRAAAADRRRADDALDVTIQAQILDLMRELKTAPAPRSC
jgi:ABC-type dipeptide/oligopeptide/nickel transport system ATPase component